MLLLEIDIRSSDRWRSLPFAVQVDEQAYCVLEGVAAETRIQVPIDDSIGGAHNIHFWLLDKPQHYTQTHNDAIVSDVLLEFLAMRIGPIDVLHLLIDQASYVHDHNGHSPSAAHRFSGTMGCRGRVTWPVEFPLYLWLLEHY